VGSEIEDEAARVRRVYERRAACGLEARYEYWQPANLYIYQSRERALLAVLRERDLLPLTGREILDLGCGDGRLLADLDRYGAETPRLHGIDLLADRIEAARARLPGADLSVGDGQRTTFADASIDIVLAFTLLSSVIDDAARARIAAEIGRVLKPGGLLLVYDFRLNPFNRDARALKPDDLRALFPGWPATFRGVTLAPPITRFLAPLPGGWLACTALEMLPFLRSHYIAALQRPRAGS
jgi:SAM-dependent methyltransferase